MTSRTTGFVLALGALVLHAATAARYGYFRDELYFIACSTHLAWGYVDQPPLVAIAAWLSRPFGYALLALRFMPILSAALTVALVVELTRELGGGAFARWAAGALALLLPAYLLLGNVLTTTSLEPLTWTLAVYCALRLVRSDGSRRWWLALSLVFVFALYAKYSIGLLGLALVLGLLLTPQRRVLSDSRFLAAAAITLLLLLPNLLWLSAHGWPIIEVLRGDALHRPPFQTGLALEHHGLAANAATFLTEQLIYTNPLAAPIWIAGIVAPFVVRSLRDARFISLAALLALCAALALDAKGYYVIGLYGSLTALGCVWLERAPVLARGALVSAALALGILAAPFALPVLPVNRLIAYEIALHMTSASQPRLVQPVFAEEFGWRELARDVARVYDRLPPAQRSHATIYADTYGDAAALDFFGPRYGLPPAISTQNSFYLWGPGRNDGTTLVAVGATHVARLRRYYRHVRLVATSFNKYRWIVEGPSPIYLCTSTVAPLERIWPYLRWYGA